MNGTLPGKVYRLVLHAFPSSHRAIYGDEMVHAFEEKLRDRRTTFGRGSALRFAVAACADAVSSGAGERRRQRSRRPAGGQFFRSAGRDFVYATRALTKARGFTAVSLLSLGIGIGIVMVIGMSMRGLTGAPPLIVVDRLVELLVIPRGELLSRVGDWAVDTWSHPDFSEIREAATGLPVAGWVPATTVVRADPTAPGTDADTMYVTSNYFTTLGVVPAQGPGFSGERPASPEVVISHPTWQRRLGGVPDVIGRTLVVNGVARTVVAVMPEGFRGHYALHRPGFELWLPLEEHPRLAGAESLRFNRDVDWIRLLGRLAPDTSLADANGAVASVMASIAARHPASHALRTASVEPYYGLGARRRGDGVAETTTIVVASLMVLLIVCLNMSGMVLVRTAARERELALRLAIGASRGRLMRYLLSESLVLAFGGGLLASIVVFGLPAAVTWWTGATAEIPLRPDATVVAATAGTCVLASLVFGMLPAVRFSRPGVMAALKDEAGGGGRRVGRLHRWTVAVQAGLAVPFLVMGAVRLEQMRVTAGADLGFTPAGLYAVPVDLLSALRPQQGTAFALRAVQDNLRRGSGVTAVAAANGLPLDAQGRFTQVRREGTADVVRTHSTRVSAGYFETLGVRIRRGRGIQDTDRANGEPVVVITEALSSRLFPAGDPLGQRLSFALEGTAAPVDFRWPHLSMPQAPLTFTVVGVSADVADAYIGKPAPQVFVPLTQHPASRVYIVARSSASTETMAAAFSQAMAGIFPNEDSARARLLTGERLVRRGMSELVQDSVLAGLAASAALMLAALGIFGVVGFMVATRTREIGVRIALGASRGRVLRDVLTGAVRLAAWGVAAGLGLAWVLVREISWYSMGAAEIAVYLFAAGVALTVALVAGLPAARRAAAVEPIVAMRAE